MMNEIGGGKLACFPFGVSGWGAWSWIQSVLDLANEGNRGEATTGRYLRLRIPLHFVPLLLSSNTHSVGSHPGITQYRVLAGGLGNLLTRKQKQGFAALVSRAFKNSLACDGTKHLPFSKLTAFLGGRVTARFALLTKITPPPPLLPPCTGPPSREPTSACRSRSPRPSPTHPRY